MNCAATIATFQPYRTFSGHATKHSFHRAESVGGETPARRHELFSPTNAQDLTNLPQEMATCLQNEKMAVLLPLYSMLDNAAFAPREGSL